MKTKFFALMLLAGSAMFAGPRIFVGVGLGGYRPYYAPAPVVVYNAPPVAPRMAYVAPPMPGPGYAWVNGYYAPAGAGWGWHAGYWARPPYARAMWVGPRYMGGRYFAGYWRR